MNGDIIIAPPPKDTLSDVISFTISSFIATLITTDVCWPRGLSCLNHLIVHTFTPFSTPKRSMADLLTFSLSMSTTRGTLTQSALTAYHLGPISLALGMCGSSHWAVVCPNAAPVPSTENLTTLALSFVRYTRKSLSIAPVSLVTCFMPCAMVCFATSVVATFSVASEPARLTSITSCRLGSLEFLALVVCDKVISGPAVPPLAATDAHDCVEAEGVFGCARKDRMAFWSSAFCFLRLRCSDLMSTSSFLMLSIMVFWLVMMLLCCAIVSLRLSMSRQNSSRLIPPPLYLSEAETLTIGNRGSICYIAYILVYDAVVCCLNCAGL